MPLHNPHYSAEVHGPFTVAPLGDLALEGGGALPDAHLAYTRVGPPPGEAAGTILVTTWFAGTHGAWMRRYIGPGRALDSDRYDIVVVNQLGNGLSTSPHTAPAPVAMSRFPVLGIGDDVAAQHRLLTRHLGVERLALVVGASMGAQQAWEWAVRHPEMVERIAPIAGTARTTPHNALWVDALIDAITSDPGWAGGDYGAHAEVAAGLERLAGLWAVMGFSTAFYAAGRHEELGFADAEGFRAGVLGAYFGVMDPNALLSMARKWRAADAARHTGGDLAAALGRVRARVLALPIDEDMFFPPRDVAAELVHVPGAHVETVRSVDGHLGVLGLDPGYMPQVDGHLSALLAQPA